MANTFTPDVTDANFEQVVLQSEVPVVVDFWATWCGPCKAIAPMLVQAAKDYGDNLKIVKLNVDQNPKVCSDFGIRNIPTLILFSGGEKSKQYVGALGRSKFDEFVKST